jgi:hypothetical protein
MVARYPFAKLDQFLVVKLDDLFALGAVQVVVVGVSVVVFVGVALAETQLAQQASFDQQWEVAVGSGEGSYAELGIGSGREYFCGRTICRDKCGTK